jgi:cytosine/uracil/thiamine/allantoin permease
MSEIAQRAEAAESGTALLPDGFSADLYNEDLAPSKTRDWGVYSLFCTSPTSRPCC